MNGHKDLKVFQNAYRLAMEIFHITKGFPQEEKYSLIDQIRRSSRSVAVNIAEGYRNDSILMPSRTKCRTPMQRQQKRKFGSKWLGTVVIYRTMFVNV
jgi:hypothetical protein